MVQIKKKDLIILIIPILITAVIYLFLPARIPRQFDLTGKPSSYMAKEFIFLAGLLPFIVYKSYKAKHS